MERLKKLRCAFSFFTIIPVSCPGLIPEISWYVSIVGSVLGIIAGFAFYLVSIYAGPILGAALSISLILLISGFSHLDGVLDAGDAIMVRGDPKRKVEVLQDHFLGAGGFGFAFVIYVLTFASLTSFVPLTGLLAIFLGEILSKDSYLLNSLHSNDLVPGGLFSRFRDSVNNHQGMQLSLNYFVFAAIACIFLPSLLISGAVSVGLSYLIKVKVQDSFGGLNGDILGLLGELTRMFFLFITVFVLLIGVFHFSPIFYFISRL